MGNRDESVLEDVRHYYGEVLGGTADLKTNACCSTEAIPPLHRKLLGRVHDEVIARFYGCGSPLPPALGGCTVLDLGCGSGRDAYLAAQLVGERGRVIGVDMTEAQLEVARRYVDHHAEAFGYANVAFRHGYVEDLRSADVADASVDVVISNCVINLSPDKPAVISEIFRVLKPGGELYFSDVFADRRVPESVRRDPELYGECLAGALYVEDFRRHVQALGCADYRVVSSRPIEVEDPELARRVGPIRFTSKTIRAFRLPNLEDLCEDYGQVATYRGGIEGAEHRFVLDDHHVFEAHRPERVCGNTAAMLADTRFAPWFDVRGDRSRHFGPFDCAPEVTSHASACC